MSPSTKIIKQKRFPQAHIRLSATNRLVRKSMKTFLIKSHPNCGVYCFLSEHSIRKCCAEENH